MVYFLHIMKIRISQTQTQRILLSQSMKQSIEILLLPIPELNDLIEQETQSNPLLEIDEEKFDSFSELHNEKLIKAIDAIQNESPSFYQGDDHDDDVMEGYSVKKENTLEESLLQQLRVEVTDPLELKIGELIIGNLTEDGYLNCHCWEIAQLAGTQDIPCVDRKSVV